MRTRGTMLALMCALPLSLKAQTPRPLPMEEAVAFARQHNLEILIARKQLEAARGSVVQARAGFLPSVVSSGLLRKREQQDLSRLRTDDYNASVRVIQNLYSSGANGARLRIARLIEEKRALELAALEQRVAMDVRVAYYDLLLNRAQIGVRQESVRVMNDELKVQQERLNAGTVGELNVRRAEVSLANEQPELFEAQTRLQNSFLRLDELCGLTSAKRPAIFEPVGQLAYQPRHPDLADSLAYAATQRPEVRARQIDVEIEEQQLIIDRAELKPTVDAFTGYEVYSERDPLVGQEFNHGYVVGLNASWHIFDGFLTKGRIQATTARRDAARAALEAAQQSVASDVRSAFLDLEQADRVMQSETRNVVNATDSLELARGNLSAGLGTQLDVLQAAADVTRVRTTRLSAIYLHNVALARLARATAREPQELARLTKASAAEEKKRQSKLRDVTQPPAVLSTR